MTYPAVNDPNITSGFTFNKRSVSLASELRSFVVLRPSPEQSAPSAARYIGVRSGIEWRVQVATKDTDQQERRPRTTRQNQIKEVVVLWSYPRPGRPEKSRWSPGYWAGDPRSASIGVAQCSWESRFGETTPKAPRWLRGGWLGGQDRSRRRQSRGEPRHQKKPKARAAHERTGDPRSASTRGAYSWRTRNSVAARGKPGGWRADGSSWQAARRAEWVHDVRRNLSRLSTQLRFDKPSIPCYTRRTRDPRSASTEGACSPGGWGAVGKSVAARRAEWLLKTVGTVSFEHKSTCESRVAFQIFLPSFFVTENRTMTTCPSWFVLTVLQTRGRVSFFSRKGVVLRNRVCLFVLIVVFRNCADSCRAEPRGLGSFRHCATARSGNRRIWRIRLSTTPI